MSGSLRRLEEMNDHNKTMDRKLTGAMPMADVSVCQCEYGWQHMAAVNRVRTSQCSESALHIDDNSVYHRYKC